MYTRYFVEEVTLGISVMKDNPMYPQVRKEIYYAKLRDCCASQHVSGEGSWTWEKEDYGNIIGKPLEQMAAAL